MYIARSTSLGFPANSEIALPIAFGARNRNKEMEPRAGWNYFSTEEKIDVILLSRA